jgi:propanediol dehydratase small subunit
LVTRDFYTFPTVSFDPSRDYPLGLRRPDLVRTPAGMALDDVSLDRLDIGSTDLRATSDTLRLQSEVARAARRPQLADNLLRAAELATLSEETILEIYTALRPRRSTAEQLEDWAARLEELAAPMTAAFVREAADVYAERGLFAS